MATLTYHLYHDDAYVDYFSSEGLKLAHKAALDMAIKYVKDCEKHGIFVQAHSFTVYGVITADNLEEVSREVVYRIVLTAEGIAEVEREIVRRARRSEASKKSRAKKMAAEGKESRAQRKAREAAEEAKRKAEEAEARKKADEEARRRWRQWQEAAKAKSSGFDPYDILGVARGASKEEIKKAWKSMAIKHHPDRGGDLETMKKINRAYDMVK